VSFREVVIYEKDRKFLLANSRDARLRSLLKSASTKSSRPPYLRISLTQEEQEYLVKVLATVLTEHGVGRDGELNAVGRRLEGLIDIFHPQDRSA
jgi:hypothetical protein